MGALSNLFHPDRVAVVGATDRENSVGRSILENLTESFDGEIVPINPNRDSVFGRRCYPDVERAPTVDLAVVVLPPDATVAAVREIGAAGIEAVVVITAGFSEVGSEGAAREEELVAVAEEYDLALVGPNCLGVMSTDPPLNATFGPALPLRGSISFVSQSGAFITAVVDWANEHGIGFKDVCSLGNEAVLDQTDFIRAWGSDSDTDVIVGYLEGIDDGREFIDVCRAVTAETPVVVVKSGRTEAGARAASSHTGSMAGSEQAYEAGLAQAGVLRVDTFEELFDVARTLSTQPLPVGDGVAIVTNAGGQGVMAADAVGDSRLSLASFSDETLTAYDSLLPAEASAYNPVDIIGDADAARFADAARTALEDDAVDAAVVVAAPTAVLSFDDLAEELRSIDDEYDVPLTVCLMGGERVRTAARRLRDHGVPNFFDPARAVGSLTSLSQYRDIATREYEPPSGYAVDRDRARSVLERVLDREGNQLGVDALSLLDAYGIPTPAGEVIDDPDDAEAVARRLDGPVVMKIASPDIPHKTDIGGVKVGVEDEAVRDSYEELVTRARNYGPDATVLGVLVQEQLDLGDATETIVGSNRDPQFGPVILFGLGGIFVEALADTAVRVGPISEREARSMVDELQSAPILRGARGRPPADVDAVVEAVERVSQLVTDFPAILELDVNPLVAGPDGVWAIDLQLTVDSDRLEHTS